MAAALGSACLVGFINGLGVAYLRIPSLVMTLGMNAVLAGVTLVYTNGSPQGDAPRFAHELRSRSSGGVVPWALIFWAVFSAVLIFLLRRTVFGKRLYAIGNNPKAAYLSGVPVRRVLVLTYTLCGLCAGLGGIMLTGYSDQSYLGMGDLYVLPAIAAVVVGGTSILGGSGGYAGTIAGAITIVLLQNVLQIVGIKPAGQQILYGLIILLMLFVYGRTPASRTRSPRQEIVAGAALAAKRRVTLRGQARNTSRLVRQKAGSRRSMPKGAASSAASRMPESASKTSKRAKKPSGSRSRTAASPTEKSMPNAYGKL